MSEEEAKKIRVIIAATSGFRGMAIFNPNQWRGNSKQIAVSCANQLDLLHFFANQLTRQFSGPDKFVEHAIKELQNQWQKSPGKWLQGCRYFVEVPEVHISVVAFLATIKTLLDLMSQLLSAEKIINVSVDGFHRKGDIIGGVVLNALDRNSVAGNKDRAKRIAKLIEDNKKVWIDGTVTARHLLAHPIKGSSQIYFEIEITQSGDGTPGLANVVLPNYEDKTFAEYANGLVPVIEKFCTDFLSLIKAKNADN